MYRSMQRPIWAWAEGCTRRRLTDARTGLGEHLAIAGLLGVRVELVPPGHVALLARRLCQEEAVVLLACLLLEHAEAVVIEEPQCLDHVRGRDALVLDQQQVLAVL